MPTASPAHRQTPRQEFSSRQEGENPPRERTHGRHSFKRIANVLGNVQKTLLSELCLLYPRSETRRAGAHPPESESPLGLAPRAHTAHSLTRTTYRRLLRAPYSMEPHASTLASTAAHQSSHFPSLRCYNRDVVFIAFAACCQTCPRVSTHRRLRRRVQMHACRATMLRLPAKPYRPFPVSLDLAKRGAPGPGPLPTSMPPYKRSRATSKTPTRSPAPDGDGRKLANVLTPRRPLFVSHSRDQAPAAAACSPS